MSYRRLFLLLPAVLLSIAQLVDVGPPPAAATPLAPADSGGPARYMPAAGFFWPLAGSPPVLRPFEPPRTHYGPGHRGVDLGGQVDEPVVAAADGLVVFSGVLAGRGVVSVEHEGLLRSTYEPLRPTVAVGVRVRRGDQLGLLDAGHPGCPIPPLPRPQVTRPQVTGPPGTEVSGLGAPITACLHWGLRRRLDYLNPLWPLGSRIRLLPWNAGQR